MNKKGKTLHFFFLLLMMSTLVGCGGNEYFKDLEDYILSLKKSKMQTKKNPSVYPLVPPPTLYQAQAFRDPFRGRDAVITNKDVLDNPLLGYPLNMLRFVGTLTEGSTITAYVLTPDNLIFSVKRGDVIGEHYGKINEITTSEIKIMQPTVENGVTTTQLVTLELRDER